MATYETTLKRRKREIERSMKDLKKELEEIEAALSNLEKMAGKIEAKGSVSGGSSGGGLPQPHQGPKPAEVLVAAEEILREAGKPKTRGELLRALIDRGFEFAGEDPANTLGTTLSRAPANQKFINLKGFGYWLRDLDYPPAGFIILRLPKEDDEPGKPEPARAFLQ